MCRFVLKREDNLTKKIESMYNLRFSAFFSQIPQIYYYLKNDLLGKILLI